VDGRCISCAEPDTTIFFRRSHSKTARIGVVRALSSGASLDRRAALRTIHTTSHTTQKPPTHVTADVHRFEESIAGRVYLIEVASVSPGRWRAYIVKIPGVPTALMPFYGATPADAAELLCNWLTRAHARASFAPGPV